MKKTTKKSKKQKTLDFDMKQDNEYQAEFSLGPNAIQCLEFKLDEAEDRNLTYDEVEMKAYAEAEKLWPEKSFPDLELKQIRIHCTETDEWCPVFAESMKREISRCSKSKEHNRCLVLPDATYRITPECALWLSLKKQGIFQEDEPFDAEKMHAILESIEGKQND